MITIDEITIVVDGREIIYDYSEQIPAGSITVIVGPNPLPFQSLGEP